MPDEVEAVAVEAGCASGVLVTACLPVVVLRGAGNDRVEGGSVGVAGDRRDGELERRRSVFRQVVLNRAERQWLLRGHADAEAAVGGVGGGSCLTAASGEVPPRHLDRRVRGGGRKDSTGGDEPDRRRRCRDGNAGDPTPAVRSRGGSHASAFTLARDVRLRGAGVSAVLRLIVAGSLPR